MNFNWADWAIIAVILISAIMGFKRGLVRESLSLATWVLAFIIARIFSPSLALLFNDIISTPSIRLGIAFALLFILALIVGSLLTYLVASLVKATGLSGTDRLLGVLFGVVRGIILMVVVVGLLAWLTPVSQDVWWQESTLVPHLLALQDWTREVAGSFLNALLQFTNPQGNH
jgi:membrane protein required for colicin V production